MAKTDNKEAAAATPLLSTNPAETVASKDTMFPTKAYISQKDSSGIGKSLTITNYPSKLGAKIQSYPRPVKTGTPLIFLEVNPLTQDPRERYIYCPPGFKPEEKGFDPKNVLNRRYTMISMVEDDIGVYGAYAREEAAEFGHLDKKKLTGGINILEWKGTDELTWV